MLKMRIFLFIYASNFRHAAERDKSDSSKQNKGISFLAYEKRTQSWKNWKKPKEKEILFYLDYILNRKESVLTFEWNGK